MCKVGDKKYTAAMFGVSVDKFHDHKEYLKTHFAREIKATKLGNNPDIGWCGSSNEKQLCFKSKIKPALSICLEVLIVDYAAN